MKNPICGFMFCMLVSLAGICQEQNSRGIKYNSQPTLRIGEVMKEMSTVNKLNYNKDKLALTDFKGKWLVIDFWATWCGTCVGSFPKLEALQQKYSDKLQIITVTTENKKLLNSFFDKAKKYKMEYADFDLPIVFGDTTLFQFFKPKYLPHYVWIDPQGVIRHITSYKYLTDTNLDSILNGRKIKIPVEPDTKLISGNSELLQLTKNNDTANRLLDYQVLSKRIPNAFPYRLVSLRNGKMPRIEAINIDIISLYRMAYNIYEDTTKGYTYKMLPKAWVVLELKDSSKYSISKNYDAEYEFAYKRLPFPRPTSISELQEIMKQDLNRIFKLNARWEERNVDCLVFSELQSISPESKGGQSGIVIYDTRIAVFNSTTKEVVQNLIYKSPYFVSQYPIINEIRSDKRIDFTVDGNVNNPVILDSLLSKYGLTLKKEKRVIKMLVISDH